MATRNRYAEIMANYAQSQPYSFFGYPQSYTGGYDVSQPQAYAAPVNQYADIMSQPAMSGGGGRPVDYNPEWTGLSDAGKAAFYAESPFFSKATQLGQNIFGFTKLGMLQNAMEPGFVSRQKLIAQGIDPATGRYQGGDFLGNPLASGGFVQAPGELGRGAVIAQVAQAQAEPTREPVRESPSGGGRGAGDGMGSPGSSFGGVQAPGERGRGTNYDQGGYVSMQHLQGPDPEGPDDGYASLKDGEYVINDKAVKKYGIELMNAINSGKISKGKLRGLLEM